MKWVTREKARVDRIACPWLITRFIDRDASFLFVPSGQVLTVAEREGAIPYDVPGVELGHHGERCSFDAFLDTYRLAEPALHALARIVRGADTEARELTPESAGLHALATGFQAIAQDDHDNMAKQFPAYDALYAYCRAMNYGGAASRRPPRRLLRRSDLSRPRRALNRDDAGRPHEQDRCRHEPLGVRRASQDPEQRTANEAPAEAKRRVPDQAAASLPHRDPGQRSRGKPHDDPRHEVDERHH
jgi:hypothetical protein